MRNDSHTTALLLERIRAGDSAAHTALVARVGPLLTRFARGRVPQLLRHQQDTADLVQGTWLRVLDRLPLIESRSAGDFFAYLRTVLINALNESLRRQQRAPTQAAESERLADVLVASDVAAEDWLTYEQALQTLDLEHRNLVLMRFEFGMSFVEIADECGSSADGVRMKLNRAIARMAHIASAETST